MNNKFKIIYLAAILPLFLFSACEKDGTNVMPIIKGINKKFDISAFVLGDTIEQYFDGVKMREYYGRVSTLGSFSQLAFEKDEINMELKRKSTAEVIYKQTFHISDKDNIVPKFYFDGKKISNQYIYPDPEGDDYTVNFYLSPSNGTKPADINIDVLEYYEDSTRPGGIYVVNTTSFTIAENVQVGTWSPYYKIPVPVVTPTRTDTDLYPIVVIRDAKTKDYYMNDRDGSTLAVELPYDGSSPGKVQSCFLAKKRSIDKKFYMEFYDLVQLFPR
ncbi:hypothetical protein AQ505_04470 [Pedobacter sp. PACM 27299]|uniref:hypothetical protein n=1 Tax=Pedobacter sp. PACM 27299 TaxID=1727164 RepID=UPI0007056FB1|nr:hypothetical protein [Pedobacter sp. PACM 27299]ALL04802.1 hypothetical protein AQ505_04470 [Pedobacter sp. PACM 27299]